MSGFSLRRALGWLGRRPVGPNPIGAASSEHVPVSSAADSLPASGGPFREILEQGYRIRLDLSRQVLRLEAAEEFQPHDPDTVYPTWRAIRGRLAFVSAAALVQKAKQFDEGLYAAVELLAEHGRGRFAGKAALLTGLARELTRAAAAGDAAAVIVAAARLGGLPLEVKDSLAQNVQAITQAFLANESRSKPLGFYTWSKELEAVFRQDRLLQGELAPATREELADALRRNPALRGPYESCLELAARLTNPPATSDLRALLGEGPSSPGPMAFFPPSVSHEGGIVKRLYSDRPVPNGFSLMDELIRRIRERQLDLRPTERSGWYDYQTWAHEAFVIPDRMPEAAKLLHDTRYRDLLLEVFRGAQALARETHVDQLHATRLGLPDRPSLPPLRVHPDLSVEPVATYYRRRALGYRFVRRALEGVFGQEALAKSSRLAPEGPQTADLAHELEGMEALFQGAYLTSCREIGMTPDAVEDDGPTGTAERFALWAKTLDRDPDLGRDARMMVPVFYDVERRLTKAWVFLGWRERQIEVCFQRKPAFEVFDNAGRPTPIDRHPQLKFVGELHHVAQPVTAEVYVKRLLDRDEFRRLCDTHGTRRSILAAL